MSRPVHILTSTHWGNYLAEKREGRIHAIHPAEQDTNPSPIGQSLSNAQHPGCRVPRPSIRRGYLEKRRRSDGTKRGIEPFVAVPWDEALDIAAEALERTVTEHGNEAVFGGSYGWASAGRFHHSQSQLHRFLNQNGGYVYSVQSYSTGTSQVIIPHVFGVKSGHLMMQSPTVEDVLEHTRLVVSFGGISMKNTQINQGGIGDHSARRKLLSWRDAGVDVVCVSPVRDDVAEFLNADWWPVRPNSDVALMLGLAHTLHSEDLHDKAFLESHCVGYDTFARYLTGESDGVPKNAEWAAGLCDIGADRIRTLARRMAREPCLLSISWSLQRTENGDQPYWMIAVLGAMLGNLGRPGQGVGYGYGCIHNFGFAGRRVPPFKVGALPQGDNPVRTFIPCARIADMLLNPGAKFPFDGKMLTYPDIRLVYWAGGNPFHHHQDLNRLRVAWSKPETIIVNDPFWTATARHADIVFPATTPLEREDFAWGGLELSAAPMHRVLEPFEESRDDYAILSGLAERLGFGKSFTEERTPREWIEHLWKVTLQRAAEANVDLPDFETFWNGGVLKLDPSAVPEREFTLERFRADPEGSPLPTPSGKVEIFSGTLAAFGLEDCLGHPAWFEKKEFLGSPRSKTFPLALNSNQPVTKLHSQYDFGETSVKAKINGREAIRIHPQDAEARNITDGDIVRVFNDRGATLAGAVVTDRVRPGVVVLPTGAWYDPEDPAQPGSLDVHGNPNVLTPDVGTSTLAQGTSAHSCLVEVERYDRAPPEVKVFRQPPMAERSTAAGDRGAGR
ncbi:MAG TPA: molybdopterin-dependent oxidoreductase [Gammaproteobacteria bacterium]|nr:molybdopterin-dependent oxidoreductase [Gammaproteobacteria bacterium]